MLLAKTFTVTNTLDDGSTGSLRWAINSANADIGLGTDTIAFDIPGPGVHTIAVGSPLPVVGARSTSTATPSRVPRRTTSPWATTRS